MGVKAGIVALTGLILMASSGTALAWPAPGTVQNFDVGYIIYTADGFQYCMTNLVRPGRATPPNGSVPWMTATIEGGINTAPGTVTLTLSAPNLTALNDKKREYVKQWLFNLDPNMNPQDLVFSGPAVLSGQLKTNGAYAHAKVGDNKFNGQDAGKFDIQIKFASLFGANNRFDVGDSVQYTITGINALTAESFLVATDKTNFNKFTLHTEAEVGGAGPKYNKDTWVLPEPATLCLLGIGGGALVLKRVRKHRNR
jgi:hypothetical protein